MVTVGMSGSIRWRVALSGKGEPFLQTQPEERTRAMTNNLQQAVADLETELDNLKNENANLRNRLELVTSEHDRTVSDLEKATARSENNLVRCIQMETIINQVSAGLLDGLARMKTADPAEVLAAHQAIGDRKRAEAEAAERAAEAAKPQAVAVAQPSAAEVAVAAALDAPVASQKVMEGAD
jgi:hypothetical protein